MWVKEHWLRIPLRVMLGAGSPHQRVLELLRQRRVQLVAQVLRGDASSPRAQHHRVRKVGLMPRLLGEDSHLWKGNDLGFRAQEDLLVRYTLSISICSSALPQLITMYDQTPESIHSMLTTRV